MKKTHVAAALLFTLAAGFISGRLSNGASVTESNEVSASGTSERMGRTRASERAEKDSVKSNPQRLRDEIRKAGPQDLAALLYRSLEISDPLLRRQLIMDIYGRMDAGNFEMMIRESERSSLETSRSNYDEWIVMLVRSGEVGGQAAMDLWSGDLRRNWDQLSRTMQGWAMTDPNAAMRWIDQQNLPPTSRANMIGAMMAGAISRNGIKALDLLASLPEADRLTSVSQITHHLTQNAGKDGLIEWVKSVNASDPGTPYANKVVNSVVDKLVWAGANQYKVSTVVADLQRISTVVPLDENHFVRAISQVGAREKIRSIELLDQLTRSSLIQNQSPLLLSVASQSAIRSDRAGVEKWLTENPNSPIHEKISEALNRASAPEKDLIFESPEVNGQ